MSLPRNPVSVQKNNTFDFWRQETNAITNVINEFLTGGEFKFDSGVFTNVDITNGNIENVSIDNSTIDNSTITNSTINDITLSTGTISNVDISNSTIETTDIESPGIKGTWEFNTYSATLNISTGTASEANAKGVGGNSELFWDRTNQKLKIFDGTTVGGKTAAIGASITQWLPTAVYAENAIVTDEGGVYVSLINNNENIKPSQDLGFDSWEVVNRSYVDDTATALAIALG